MRPAVAKGYSKSLGSPYHHVCPEFPRSAKAYKAQQIRGKRDFNSSFSGPASEVAIIIYLPELSRLLQEYTEIVRGEIEFFMISDHELYAKRYRPGLKNINGLGKCF